MMNKLLELARAAKSKTTMTVDKLFDKIVKTVSSPGSCMVFDTAYRYYLQFDSENKEVYTFTVGVETKRGDEFIPTEILGEVSFSRNDKFIGTVNPEVRHAMNEFIVTAYEIYMQENDICCIDSIPNEQRWPIVYDVFTQIAENQSARMIQSDATEP